MDFLYRHRQILRTLWFAILATIAIVLVLLVLDLLAGWVVFYVLLGVAVVLGFIVRHFARRVPQRSVLEVNFESGLVEHPPREPAMMLAPHKEVVVRDVVDALKRAGDDSRITGLVARIGPTLLGVAQVQEIRGAVAAFRAKGKKTIAWCQTLGDANDASVAYYLASAFEEIHLQPVSDLVFTGILWNQPLLRPLLRKLGINPQLDHREKYKTAKYMFTEEHLLEPHRESYEHVVKSIVGQMIDGIAQDRKLQVEEVRRIMDEGVFRPEEAVEMGLVDELSYIEDLRDRIKERHEGKLLYLKEYLARAGRPMRKGKSQIAIIHGTGGIARGRNRRRHMPSEAVMGSDEMGEAIRDAMRAQRVKAIVLRVNSPGGSAVASEAIWRQVRRAIEAGKPVVASLSNIAGSGGYYIAVAADRIVAQPGTITGSIGVVAGKFVTHEAWKKVGINWEGVAVGANADFTSSQHEFSEAGWQKVQRALDGIYQSFKQRVGDARGLNEDQVEQVAKGRIWTGEQAKENGLVDELGGIDRAIEIARELARIPVDERVQAIVLPRPRYLPPQFSRKESSDAVALREMAVDLMEAIEPLGRIAGELRATQEGPLRMTGCDSRLAM